MQVDEIEIDATVIKFFDDHIVDEEIETVKKNLDITVANMMKKLIDTENL